MGSLWARVAAVALGVVSVAAAGSPVQIMPLGDSITWGANSPGGYRARLASDLQGAGLTFTLIGSQTGNSTSGLQAAGQASHEGHPGYRIDDIGANLSGYYNLNGDANGGHWLTGTGSRPAAYPDIILLHAGTNDALQGFDLATMQGRMHQLVADLYALRPGVHLLVAGLIPINDAHNSLVQSYNSYLENTLVPEYDGLGKSILFVDQYRGFMNANNTINTGLLTADGVHPNQAGYDVMGDTWSAAVRAVPEPGATALLLGLGAVALAWRRRA